MTPRPLYAFNWNVAPWSRFPSSECSTVVLRAVDDAGAPVPSPPGGTTFLFDVVTVDGGVIPTFSWSTLTQCPNLGRTFALPNTFTIPAGTSSLALGVQPSQFGQFRLRATRAGVQTADTPALVPPTSISDDLALLPFFGVNDSGQVAFRAYALWTHAETNGAFIGFLNSTSPISHVIRPTLGGSTAMLVLNNGLANPLTGNVTPLPVAAVDGVSRLRNDRVVTFGASTGALHLSVLQVSTLGASVMTSASPSGPVQANTNGGGEVAVALAPTARSFSSEDVFGPRTIWFTTRGDQVPVVIGSMQYSFSGVDALSSLMTQETSLTPGAEAAHAAMSLGPQTVLFTVGQNRGAAILPPAMPGQYPTSYSPIPSLGTGNTSTGPENFVHISFTPSSIAYIARPPTPGVRRYDFMEYDAADGGSRTLRTMYPDLQTTDPQAVTDPNLARGCVVNTRWGVTFFYSTRVAGTSQYRHLAQPYRASTGLGTPVPVEVPGMEDALISCGGSRLHHVDLWPY